MNETTVNHRVVAATFSQAKYWDSGRNRITCLKLSNDIALYFVKGVSTTIDITTAVVNGYRTREYTFTLPNTISTTLYANNYVENTLTWENVEFKIHSISTTQILSHFWCKNAYSNLTVCWYYMLVARL